METASPSRKHDAIRTEMEAAAACSSIKRARVLGGVDRLGNLPDCLLHEILSLLGSRQVVRTSALSRRWRHLWHSVHCLDIDQREFVRPGVVPTDNSLDEYQWECFEDMADTVLSSSSAPLDAFRLHLVDQRSFTTVNRWVRRGLRRRPVVVDIHAYDWKIQLPPTSRLGSDTCRVTKLRLFGVLLLLGFGDNLGDQFPVLEDLHIENCKGAIKTIASPTLKSLTFVGMHHQYNYAFAHLVLAVPGLASLRLVLPYGRYHAYHVTAGQENEGLASLVMASICIKDMDRDVLLYKALPQDSVSNKRKLDYLRSVYSFLACLTNVTNLYLSGFLTTALLDEKYQEFPVFSRLRTLILDRCDIGFESQALQRIWNTPNLEKLGLYFCTFLDQPRQERKKIRLINITSNYRRCCRSILLNKKLESLEIKYHESDKEHLDRLFSQIPSRGHKEMWLAAEWQQVKKLSNEGQATTHLFRTKKRTERPDSKLT